jgi:hypothetical protein
MIYKSSKEMKKYELKIEIGKLEISSLPKCMIYQTAVPPPGFETNL